MIPNGNEREQEEKLKEMDYSPSEDIFNQAEQVPLDGDGNIMSDKDPETEGPGDDLDVPGSMADDAMENIGSEDEENNYYSQSDNADNHEEVNDDLLS